MRRLAERAPELAAEVRGRQARGPRRASPRRAARGSARRSGPSRAAGGVRARAASRAGRRGRAASRPRSRCARRPRCSPRGRSRAASWRSSSSIWKMPAELFISISMQDGRSSPARMRTVSIAAADSEWIERPALANGIRERPLAMSSASATRTIPASSVSGSPSARCGVIALQHLGDHDRALGLVVDAVEHARQHVGGDEEAPVLVAAPVDRHPDAVQQAPQRDDDLGVLVASSRSRAPCPAPRPARRGRAAASGRCSHDLDVHPRVVVDLHPAHRVHVRDVPPGASAGHRRWRASTTSRSMRLPRARAADPHRRDGLGGRHGAPRSASTETPRCPVGGGSRCSSSAMAHTVHDGAHPAPDVAGALPAAQVLVAQATRSGGRADRRGDCARRPRARPVLRLRRRADRGGGARPPGARDRRQPVRDLPRPRHDGTLRPRRHRRRRGTRARRRTGDRGAVARHGLPAVRRRGRRWPARRAAHPRSWQCWCAAHAVAARAARSRWRPT